ncbi:MAG: cytochrome C biosynthesis protein, partial [Bacteroidetes bacterium]|nr:cytochrome C biosynthesis protein [Bacteroidota bacterium]
MRTLSLNKYLSWACWIILILIGIVFGIKQLREPDIWWMLRTGEWILANGQAPTEDVFSFTQINVQWINVKWLFEVIIYGLQKIGGPEFVFILQSLVNSLLLLFTFKTFNTISGSAKGKPSMAILIVLLFMILGIEFRMIGRPELSSHLMTAIFLFIYMSYRKQPGKIIYWIIPLMVLWTNLHEAFGTGMVIIVAMGSTLLFDQYVLKLNSGGSQKHLLIASSLALLAPALHPYGPSMILHPYEIFTQVGENKFTTELYSFTTDYYWQQPEPYFALIFLGLSLLAFLIPFNKEGRNIFRHISLKFGSGYLVLIALFFYLSLTAHRNIVFFLIVSAPLAGFTIQYIVNQLSEVAFFTKLKLPLVGLFLIAVLALYVAIGSNVYYEKLEKRDRYGLQLYTIKNSPGSAKFLNDNQVTGRAFSDYLTSSYMLWAKRPEFKSFIDLRDLDIISADFFY